MNFNKDGPKESIGWQENPQHRGTARPHAYLTVVGSFACSCYCLCVVSESLFSSVQFSSVQYGICALGKAHMRSGNKPYAFTTVVAVKGSFEYT